MVGVSIPVCLVARLLDSLLSLQSARGGRTEKGRIVQIKSVSVARDWQLVKR